ncbi:MAG: amidohydrolase/deacetylase family metallohydrolase [Alphaproteobacteria bacterium]|nr:amidohydrolase/deacetylase family metallohydrolase [Alphaproteobacteria bacterium]
MYDIVLTGGRVVDPSQGLDAVTDVAFSDGKVAALGQGLGGKGAKSTRDVSGQVVAPGLIDIHAHVYWGATFLGVEAERVARASGTTTFVDAGSAGAGTFHGFRKLIIEPCPLRIVAFLNISHAGIFGYGPGFMVGESAELRLLHAGACVKAARQHADLICGVKVRLGNNVSELVGIGALDVAVEAAEELGLPVMVHIGAPPPRRKDILDRMRPGDILTHCCRMFPNAATDRERNIRREVEEARERGIVFDVGHGRGSFDFDVARAMVDNGFMPDVLSSDVHVHSIGGPAFDVLVTMSKFLSMGVALSDVVAAATCNPARAIARPELGSLKPGSPGDAVVLAVHEGAFEYRDSLNKTVTGKKRLEPAAMIVGGKWWE